MNKIILAIGLIILPALGLAADSSLAFTPPATDYSIIFLSNIFGVVDGVLHGTGSQIMGAMFGVFNAAVLALGGIIIMYTLLVSTMNTAHEGQFLGQKWSSIWVPVRTTFGLALLIPKASGYCLMQIFVMWIVVQGVGAADKIWGAALSYLNQGGSIIIAQEDPTKALTAAGGSGIADGAQTILAGQVCMLGLEKQLRNYREYYLRQKQNKTGPCYGTVSDNMQVICNTSVPSFLDSVNILNVRMQDDQNQRAAYEVPMPNFDSTSPYQPLNGICGTINWSRKVVGKDASTIAGGDVGTLEMSRAIAIQQMFVDLASIAQVMVNNNPELSDQTPADQTQTNYSEVAEQNFGVAVSASGAAACGIQQNAPGSGPSNNSSWFQQGGNMANATCHVWNQAPGAKNPPLFTGTEFRGAISDYDAVMRPLLTLENEAQNKSSAEASRAFIQSANAQGWLMAGSYFFDLVLLNQQALEASKDAFDSNTGLNKSSFDVSQLTKLFTSTGCDTTNQYSLLCTWLNQDKSSVEPITTLISGGGGGVPNISPPTNLSRVTNPVTSTASSTVYGFTTNQILIQPPQQAGQNRVQFADMMHVKADTSAYALPSADFPCGKVKILFFSFCLGELIGDVVYNAIIVPVYNAFLGWVNAIIEQLIFTFLLLPLEGISAIFRQGVEIISTPGINPIVALAQMGTYYINFAGTLFILMLELSIVSAIIPWFGVVVFVIMVFSGPLLLAWLGIMVSVGFITAYYVPILPYMIFTFATIAWLIAVIEAMVAAPIVALGVTHPEGHEAFGKGEQAIMILMNVFLRPSMMIIGYIAAISLSYVGVWILNAGFDHAIAFIQPPGTSSGAGIEKPSIPGADIADRLASSFTHSSAVQTSAGNVAGGYIGWAGVFAYFFSILMYTMMYLTIVQRSFTLITYLPDKVLRWIGGAPETIGSEAAQWGEEAKGKVEGAAKETSGAQAATQAQLQGKAQELIEKGKKGASKPDVKATGGKGAESTPSGGGDEGSSGGGAGGGGATPPAEPMP
ncbi:type IVB secretion system protein DotA [Legionella yabuuchiae]|uniref:type IVB secretion system protein DotA n=1 Tax=Legionella yabuuchiae TaxID=376727 RepID=UPI001056DE63|nr:type IVB secretion system protein DotA [Legionella yabuuchiae]